MKALVTRYGLEFESVILDDVTFRVMDSGRFGTINVYYDEQMRIPLPCDEFMKDLDTIVENAHQQIINDNSELKVQSEVNHLLSKCLDYNILFLEGEPLTGPHIVLRKYPYFDQLKRYLKR
ncbi:hypothetical protein LCGC14_0828930 [marine sediment metagenome]|uniref:Uncharacterized protein n=1 Tax=marine sediment metagenome TaxID=412755 RepID=A0A0F9Q1R7_9ZZZZ